MQSNFALLFSRYAPALQLATQTVQFAEHMIHALLANDMIVSSLLGLLPPETSC